MPHRKFPYYYWKDEQGPERARVIMGNWIRELGLEDATPDVLYQRLSHAEFRKHGLAGMLMQVYGGRKSAAILDYLQTASLKMGASSYQIEEISPRRFQTHRLSLRFLGAVEVTIDGVRVEGLERPSRLRSVLCLLALYRYGLRPERLSALLSGENSLPDLRLRETALRHPPGISGACGAELEPSSRQEQGQEQTVTAAMEARETRAATTATVTHKVRQMVYRIRQTAGWHDIVVFQAEGGIGETVYSLPDDTWCDIWDFEDRLSEAERYSNRPDDPQAARVAFTLRGQAIELYRGEMDRGMEEVATIAEEAIRLHERYVGALLDQATFWARVALNHRGGRNTGGVRSGNSDEAWRHALGYYMQAVRGDRHNESAYVGAMRCHAHLGNWVKVQQVFNSCRGVLASELGKPPKQLQIKSLHYEPEQT